VPSIDFGTDGVDAINIFTRHLTSPWSRSDD